MHKLILSINWLALLVHENRIEVLSKREESGNKLAEKRKMRIWKWSGKYPLEWFDTDVHCTTSYYIVLYLPDVQRAIWYNDIINKNIFNLRTNLKTFFYSPLLFEDQLILTDRHRLHRQSWRGRNVKILLQCSQTNVFCLLKSFSEWHYWICCILCLYNNLEVITPVILFSARFNHHSITEQWLGLRYFTILTLTVYIIIY